MQTCFIQNFLRPFVWLFCRIYFRIEFIGAEHVPLQGAVILAPNHVSYGDPIWVSVPLKRCVYYMAWDQVFKIPVLGWLMTLFGAFPVKLERFDRSAIQAARQVLLEGKGVMIFPEGGRTFDGKLHPFKPGVSRLALTTGTPIVPITISGAYQAWSPHHLLPRPRKVKVIYHAPITVPQLAEEAELNELRAAARELSDKLHQIVASGFETPATETRPQAEFGQPDSKPNP